MADVRPLRGIRFDRRFSGPVGPLIAPPYDVVAQPGSSAEFSISGVEFVDLGVSGNQHEYAARRYDAWRRQGVLHQDEAPAIYVHHHRFALNGAPRLRTGLLARIRLSDWSDRIVLPHERTMPGPRTERLERLRAVRANLSPLYFLYRDPDGEVRELLAPFSGLETTAVDRDRMGGTHQLLPATESDFHQRLARIFSGRTLFVADGHHRYEAALTYRNERRLEGGEDGDAPWEFVLALLSAVEDPGVAVRPAHRLLAGGVGLSPGPLLDLLGRWFTVQAASGAIPETTEADFLCRVVLPSEFGSWDVHAKPGNPHVALLPAGRGAAWKSLGVVAMEAVLARNGVEANGDGIDHVIDEEEAMARVQRGEAHAALLFPAPSLDRVLAVAEEGDLLPPKSTWFEPKAPAGLVINELRP